MQIYGNKNLFVGILSIGAIIAVLGWVFLREPIVLAVCCCGVPLLGAVLLQFLAPNEAPS